MTSEKQQLESEISSVKEKNRMLQEAPIEREKLLDNSKIKIVELASALAQANLQNYELEEELKKVSVENAEHEGRTKEIHQRSLELKDLLQSTHSKFEGAARS
ncbi:hypothetical protein AKJ16_DCAP19096 [Drosera capensis]